MGTQRSKSELDTLFLDNELRLITPERVRDFIESSLPTRAFMNLLSATTTISSSSTWVKAANLTSLSSYYRISMPINNRLQYTGSITTNGILTVSLTLSASSNNQAISCAIFKNGLIINETVIDAKLGTGGDLQSVSLSCHCVADTDDYLELYVQNKTSASNLTITKGNLVFFGFLS